MRWLALVAFLGLPARAHVSDNVTVPDEIDRATFCVCDSYQLADVIKNAAAANNVDPYTVLAVIHVESRCNPKAIGSQNDSGLMQIIPRWHQARINKLGVTNLLDPAQNIAVGTHYLGELGSQNNERPALAKYNGGVKPGKKALAYADHVLKYKKQLVLGQCQAK
jgi:soluble lytic murein transglycosylase-like protein